MIIKKVFYSLKYISNFNYDWIEDRLLLYIYSKSRVKKSKIIYMIKLRYIILLQDFDLIITTLISAIVDNIGDSIIYISLAISIKNRHKKWNTISHL